MSTPGRRADVRAGALPVLIAALLVAGCGYVVIPPEEEGGHALTGKGWSAVATAVNPMTGGGLQIDLTITNDTGAWSAMQTAPGQAATLTAGGATTSCATVVVGTGGHRLAPGFRMRGFTTGPKTAQVTELLRVACSGATAAPGSRLQLDYTYVTGEYNYYEPEATRLAARLEVDLDQVATGLSYPVADAIEGLVIPPDTEITAINDVTLTLVGTRRSATGLTSTWHTANAGDYPTYVHIGEPPVIGSDGVIYGRYQSPDIATSPVTPAKGEAEWTTEVAVPTEVTGLTMLLSVESKKQRLFVQYAIGLADA